MRPLALLRAARSRSVPAGLADSALSSLATFLVGLAAVRYLALQDLGVYALAYTAFLLGTAVPAMLVFTPAEVQAIASREGAARMAVVRRSLLLGLPFALLAGALVGLGTVLVPSTAPLSSRIFFAVSVVAVCGISPLQDHLRRVLHMADRSWLAARTAGVQVGAVSLLLAVLVTLGLADSPFAPFGVLAASNLVSSAYALLHCLRQPDRPPDLPIRRTLTQGRALLGGAVASFSGGFVVMALITSAAGPGEAARFEAARLLAQPVSVALVGVLAVLGPRIMGGAVSGDVAVTRRLSRLCMLLTVALVVPYAALTGLWVDGNPLRDLVPRAFEVEFLLPAMVVAQAVGYAVAVYRYVPLALRRSAHVLAIELASAAAAIGLAAVLAERGAWGAVIATGSASVLGLSLFALDARLLLRRVVEGRRSLDPPAQVDRQVITQREPNG